jgi:acyl-coenzyme A synthetase/AMP-(fatty) acid ligase
MIDLRILDKWAQEKPEQPAFIDEVHSINFAELNSLVRKTATLLSNYGVKKGEVVNVVLPSFASWTTILAVHYLGATSMTFHGFSKLKMPFQVDWNISVGPENSIPLNRNIIYSDSIFDIIKSSKEFPESIPFKSSDGTVRIFSTSGTTGETKFVPYLVSDLNQLDSTISSWEVNGSGNALSLFAMSAKQAYRHALKHLVQGKTLFTSSFTDYRFAKFLRNQNIETIFGSPGQISNLVDLLKHTGTDLPKLKILIMGGSAPTPFLLNKIKKVTNSKLINTYGSTEVGYVGSMELTESDDGLFKLSSNIEFEIVDENDALNQLEVRELLDIDVLDLMFLI